MDSNLYPDLAAVGSLASALERAAAGLGVDLVTVPGGWGSAVSAGIAASVPEREPLSVHIGAEYRWFGFSGWSRGVELITGATSALEDVVRAGVAWGEGRSLRALQELLPFVHFSELTEAHERGPAAAVEVRWRLIREEAAEAPDFPEFGLLVEAAHAEPRLRQLYPFSSHWTLGFNARTGIPCPPEVAIAPSYEGLPYRVQKFPHGGVIAEAVTVEEAIALAVAHLPAGLGAAVAGTSEPPR
ncbi:DUF6193 family natural product biosynthesis protein [Streptomyces sp. NBC_01224]|uniref:DUF6193 family natural product biosynthesis protein n=1 Tax=Streptomyces sp. NBC_01224 TaxID=2903783 RepID=UPI002E0E0C54|nr:DUF6193 family natural product biosynthesis protein [Streptomyces sp. NBC_01224]